MIRRSPTDGYDVGRKRQYEREVVATAKRHCPVPMADAEIFMLPSAECNEPRAWLAAGAREDHLHLCDENPAVVARHIAPRFPLATRHGIPAHRVFAERPHFYHIINLDLTCTVERAARTLAAGVLALHPGGCIAVTWLKGRDRAFCEWARHVRERVGRDCQRVDYASALVRAAAQVNFCDVLGLRHEDYRIAHSPMQWTMWKVAPVEDPWTIAPHIASVQYARVWIRLHLLLGGTPNRRPGARWVPELPGVPPLVSRQLLEMALRVECNLPDDYVL